jgi:pimeloyl-ACP methyl ester carboxylesterase/sugar lactone lactonase YvrE
VRLSHDYDIGIDKLLFESIIRFHVLEILMQTSVLRIFVLSLMAVMVFLKFCAGDSLTTNSPINPDDTYVTFDETTVRQAKFDASSEQSGSSAAATGKQPSSVTRETQLHVEEGYDLNGDLVLDVTFVTSAPAYKTIVKEARFSGGKIEFFDANGAPVHLQSGEAQIASALSNIPGASLIKGTVVQDIQAYAKAVSATIVGNTLSGAGPATVTLSMPSHGSASGTFTKTFTLLGQGWVLSQVAVTRPIANGNTSSVTSFSNVLWHQNATNDAARNARGTRHSTLTRRASFSSTTRAGHAGAQAISPKTSCGTTVTQLGGSQNVVFQHGLLGSSCSWTNSTYSMTAELNSLLSFKTEIVPSLTSTDSLASQTSALVTQLQTSGGSHYVLIGHSQGGLISRSAAQYFQSNSSSTVTGVITVDTPNMGAAVIENSIGAASQLGNYLNFPIDDIDALYDCYDDFGDYGPFCSVGCGDPNGGALVCGLLLAGAGDGNIINDAIDAAGIFVLNQAVPATVDLEPGSAFLDTLNSYPENFIRVGISSDSSDFSPGPFLPEHMGGDLVGGTALGQDAVATLQAADIALNGIIAYIIELEEDPDGDDCYDPDGPPDPDACYDDDVYIDAYAAIDNDIYVPDEYWDSLVYPAGDDDDFSDGIVNGLSQYYPPDSTVTQYVILGADTHLGSTKSAYVASALTTALERIFFVPALGCTYALSPASVTEAASGGKGTFAVTTAAGCAWTVVSSASWITFTPASGTGSSTITYTIAANTGDSRSGNLMVAGIATFSVTQNGNVTETLTVTLNGGGTVMSSPAGISCPGTCSAAFSAGTIVNLSVSPAIGYAFTGWSGACSGVGPCAVTMSSAESVSATFTSQPAQTLGVAVSGSGTVTSSPSGISCPGTCSAPFAYGTTVSLTASPARGYILAGWGGACSGTGTCALAMTNANSVSAGFEQPPPGIINTVAGNGTAGYSGDGGVATSAELHGPNAVAVDTAGNIYIADYYNNRIRKVTASTGVISTAAGNGTAGYSGDGGAATSAELNGPGDVAVDSAGNIYISDLSNNRIRKVTVSTGVISTVAGNGTKGYSGDGGAATSAEIGSSSVTVDTAGNIYLADDSNNRIRKVTVSTGIITTVAGNGTAGFSGDGGAATSAELDVPDGVVVDSAGNIYIADHNNERIRKVTVSTGKISTVAGDGTAGYAGDGGAATSAELNGPGGLALDSAGDIYIGDFGNNRIRKVTVSTGKISTVAGNGTAGYSGDGGAPNNAEMNGPSGIALDSAGNIYIADFGNNRIRFVGP